MKVTDLIKALKEANELFIKKHKEPLEIFDLVFNEDDYDGDMKIEACGEVAYEDNIFGQGTKRGRGPKCHIRVHFICDNDEVIARKVTIEKD